MLQNMLIAAVGTAVLLITGNATGLLPMGTEPVETPWRVTAIMMLGFAIGCSAGFSWLQSLGKDGNFAWPVLMAVFVTAGFFGIELNHCLESGFETVYTLPVLLGGPISLGIVVGASVRTTMQ